MKLLRDKQVAEKLACSWPHVWALTRNNPSFPKPYKISPRVTAWSDEEIDAWLLTQKQTTGVAHETERSTG
jgi:prophage regulatory protein